MIDTNEKLKEVLERFEQDTLRDTGMGKISGGFASADVFGQDDQYWDVELKWGVQSDCENRVHTEQYKINKVTYDISDA